MLRKSFLFTLWVCLFLGVRPLYADVTWSGDIDPDNPLTWNSTTYGYIGVTGYGVLNITDGSTLSNGACFMGLEVGSMGEATVDGAGSTWSNKYGITVGHEGGGALRIINGGSVSGGGGTIGTRMGSTGDVTVDGIGSRWTAKNILYVGQYGDGVLNITNGGEVYSSGDTWVSRYSGSSGTINFDNGTLTTKSLLSGIEDLNGVGTIYTGGLVSDIDLVFDATHGMSQSFNFTDYPGQDIDIHLDVDDYGAMGAGYSGNGSMSIYDGINMQSGNGYIGQKLGSAGVVNVSGIGSHWSVVSELDIGVYGNGALNISNGGSVNGNNTYIGYYTGSSGEMTVDGIGSIFTNAYQLKIGDSGDGALNITNGGSVSSINTSIGSGGSGTVTVDGIGSKWINSDEISLKNGALNIINGGSVTSTNSQIGIFNEISGVATVDGIGSTWITSEYLTQVPQLEA